MTLIYIGHASRFIGLLLIAIFVIYNLQLVKKKNGKEISSYGTKKSKIRKYITFTVIGAAIVVTSAYFIVGSATYIAVNIGIPTVVIGATIVAFGTSLPEFMNSIEATRKGHLTLALGNIVGSCFINMTLILGVALIGSPLRLDMVTFSNLVLFSIITNLILWYFLTGDRLGMREGVVFLFMYFLFLAISFGLYSF